MNLVDPFGLSAEARGEDSQVTWSNRTLDDNGLTSHFENADYHDPYRSDSMAGAPSYDDMRRAAYEDARNRQRAEAYVASRNNDLNQLRNEPLEYQGFTPEEYETMMSGVMFLCGAGEMAVGMAGARGMSLLAASRSAPAASNAGRTVLGHYPTYVEKAAELGARRFNIPTHIWNKMSLAEQWAANQKFLDRAIARGDEIILATPASAARAGSFFASELKYLRSHGYQLAQDGMRMFRP